MAGETEPVLVDLVAGAAVRFSLSRTGRSGELLPRIAVKDPGGVDRTDSFGLRVRHHGGRVTGAVMSLPESGTWTFTVRGDSDTAGDWKLSIVAHPRKKFRSDVTVPPGEDGILRFDVLAGSGVKVTLTDVARAADPVLIGIEGPNEQEIPLAGARTSLRRHRLKVRNLETAATGAHELHARLSGDAGGTLSVIVRAKAPRPRRERLVHPGGGTGGEALAITTSSLPAGEVGSAYAASVAATGGTAPYVFEVLSGHLPDGLALGSGGEVTGVPTTAETQTFTVRVTDSADPAATADRELEIRIDAASSGSLAWAELTPGGTAPGGRSSAGYVYDPVNARMIVALGATGTAGPSPVYSDTAALSLGGSPAWTALGTGPAGRWGPSLVFDTNRERAILYGGNVNGFQTNGEVWALDCSTAGGGWTELSPSGTAPPARVAHAAVYDPDHDRMIVFAGDSGVAPGFGSPMNDVWELSFAGGADGAWTERSPTGAPDGRAFPAAVFDAANGRMVTFGGLTNTGRLADVFSLDLGTPGSETWTQLTPSGTAPSARDELTAVYDSKAGRMVLFGGLTGSGTDTNEVYALDLTAGSESFSKLTPDGTPPAARDSHAAVYDPPGERMILFSGYTGFPSTPFTDGWELRLP